MNFTNARLIMKLPLQEARLSDTEPIVLPLARKAGGKAQHADSRRGDIAFDRRELTQILNVYGRKVASGEWRDYAIDLLKEKAVFSVFRRASEMPALPHREGAAAGAAAGRL